MRKKIFTTLQYILFLGLGIFLVWWSIHKMDDKNWEECKDALSSARYGLFIPVFFILSASHLSRALRWRLLMKPLGYTPRIINTFCAVMIGYLANMAVPRLGEVLKCTILARYEKVPADKLVGTILVERAADVVGLCIIFFITLVTQFNLIGQFFKETIRKNFLQGGLAAVGVKLGILITVTGVLYFLGRWAAGKFSHINFIKKIKNLVSGVKAGLTSVAKMEDKWAFILHSIFIWGCYTFGTYIGFYATAGTTQLPFAAAFPVLAFASIGMIITPGGIGAYPYFIKEVMLRYNIDEGIGNANGILQWMAQCVIVFIVGLICLSLLPYFNKSNRAVSQSQTPV